VKRDPQRLSLPLRKAADGVRVVRGIEAGEFPGQHRLARRQLRHHGVQLLPLAVTPQ